MALSQQDDLGRAKVTFFLYDEPRNRPDQPSVLKILPWAQLTLSDGTQYNITVPPVLQLGGGVDVRLDDDGSGTLASSVNPLFFGVASGPVQVEFQRAEDRCGATPGEVYQGGGTTAGFASAVGDGTGERPNSVMFIGGA